MSPATLNTLRDLAFVILLLLGAVLLVNGGRLLEGPSPWGVWSVIVGWMMVWGATRLPEVKQ
jgi:hypothetical protein